MVGRLDALPPHVHPVGQQEFDVGAWPVVAMALIVDPAGSEVVDPELAVVTLGLTGMKARVTVLLAPGLSVGKITRATVSRRAQSPRT